MIWYMWNIIAGLPVDEDNIANMSSLNSVGSKEHLPAAIVQNFATLARLGTSNVASQLVMPYRLHPNFAWVYI